jgi:hypothetical protein
VEEHEPEGLRDVQRFYIVLRPEGGRLVRLLVVGRKRLPKAESHDRNWGFVDLVTDSGQKVEEALRETRYSTGTRGERAQPAARPAGEGVYALLLRGDQLHLAYALELPAEPDEVQEAFRIAPEAAYALSIKNPDASSPKGAGLSEDEKADYPDRLQEEFRGRRFAREDARLLDHEGAEFILVGARRDPERAYDIDLEEEDEDAYARADAIRKLHAVRSRHPVEPLFKGTWN